MGVVSMLYKDSVKFYYDNGYWDEEVVHIAVEYGGLTKEDYKEITGLEYEEDKYKDM